jgi:LacI family transcriptional regulator
MQRHGLPVPDHYVARGDFRSQAPSVNAAKGILQLPVGQRPTAIFCAGDLMALAVLQVAAQLRVLVPEQLSVVGFADFRVAEFPIRP